MEPESNRIDDKIKKLVVTLNYLGIPTTGSCEGHADHGSPAPWIKITPHGAGDPIQIQKTVSALLSSFYKVHIPDEDARFITENANVGFWIHNGGEDYLRWREGVKRTAQEPRAPGKMPNSLTTEEIRQRNAKLPGYQQEILLLAKFLKEIFDSQDR